MIPTHYCKSCETKELQTQTKKMQPGCPQESAILLVGWPTLKVSSPGGGGAQAGAESWKGSTAYKPVSRAASHPPLCRAWGHGA